MARLSVLTWIGNAAASLFGRHGAVTEQAHQTECSRQTVYDHAAKVLQAVTDAQRPGLSRTQLLQDNDRLRDENRQLWDALEEAWDYPNEKRRPFAVTATAMGLSLGQIGVLLALLLPPRRVPCRATLGRWVQQAARRAGRLLGVLDAACRPWILCLCLDEIFCRRTPVLMGIEPHSMAWVLGQRVTDRSGPTWCRALAPWSALQDVAADGGSGIELGLRLTAQRRQEEAQQAQKRLSATATGTVPPDPPQALPLRIRLDVFHTQREGERALRCVWSAAEALWEEAEKVSHAKGRFDRGGTDRRLFKQDKVARVWAPAEAAFHAAEHQEQAWRRAVAALALFRPDGRLNDRTWAAAELQAATAALTGPRWAKTKRMLLDERTLCFLDRLHEDLQTAEPCPERREALVALWRWQRQEKPRGPAGATAVETLRPVWSALLRQRLGDGWAAGYRRVSQVLRRLVRASSAVECVNSVLRMHQSRHRHLSQDLLNLKRLYWNCRSFVSGQRQGRCPYEHLGLKLPTYDPWALLAMEPEQLTQQLSSSEVTK